MYNYYITFLHFFVLIELFAVNGSFKDSFKNKFGERLILSADTVANIHQQRSCCLKGTIGTQIVEK